MTIIKATPVVPRSWQPDGPISLASDTGSERVFGSSIHCTGFRFGGEGCGQARSSQDCEGWLVVFQTSTR
jgi:hypothetical protein